MKEEKRTQAQLAGRMSPGKMSPWKPSPLGKGLTLSTDDRNASWIPANTVFQMPVCAIEQLGSWALCGQREVLGEFCDGHKGRGELMCDTSVQGAREKSTSAPESAFLHVPAGRLRAACSCSPSSYLCGNGYMSLQKHSYPGSEQPVNDPL